MEKPGLNFTYQTLGYREHLIEHLHRGSETVSAAPSPPLSSLLSTKVQPTQGRLSEPEKHEVSVQPPSTGICPRAVKFGVCLFHPTALRRPAEAAGGTEMGSGAPQGQAAGTGDTSVSFTSPRTESSGQRDPSLGNGGVPHHGLAEPVLCSQGNPKSAVAGSPRGSQDSWSATGYPSHGEALPTQRTSRPGRWESCRQSDRLLGTPRCCHLVRVNSGRLRLKMPSCSCS